MNVEVLECFLYGKHIGRFERRYLTAVEFIYNDDADQELSLSLPREGVRKKYAARNFLANLLPESAGAKVMMQDHSGAASADDFDLLQRVGGDVSGAVQLMPEGQAPEDWGAPPAIARLNSIAGRIRVIKASEVPEAAYDTDWPVRFSLAGVQAKFALANVEGEWFWPDAGTPSTHILKPEARVHAAIERIESTALRLATAVGVVAAQGKVAQFQNQTSFITERFDRLIDGDGIAARLHVEDALQAYGEEVGFKYHLGAEEVIETLQHSGNEEAAYEFIQQLAFNIGVKNADAHGKNYSFMHRVDGHVTLSPLYDAVPMGFFPEYDQGLSMPVGDEEQIVRISAAHWRTLAAETGLDEDRVTRIVSDVAEGILEHVDEITLDRKIRRIFTDDSVAEVFGGYG